MKFNVVGVIMEDEAGCGGVLRDDIGVACALFFCVIDAKDWKWQSIDCDFNQFCQVQFAVTHWQDNGIADALAKASIRRPLFSKGW
ncbi:hypothetical protein Goshw_000309 [Gossypium schwendimanii]|uniref:RNase H type-1 domain-containing protein n=1 Tax=Gossypium schwendimanii TaxID=34291 RepID=A0A7J9KIY4_GOSSC|nr:hypothetical protein [Gossypium schwendimanii]